MRTPAFALFAGLLALRATAAHAQASRLSETFDRLDANHDGLLTRAEFLASRHARFLALDRNHDGYLTAADIPQGVALVSRRAAAIQPCSSIST